MAQQRSTSKPTTRIHRPQENRIETSRIRTSHTVTGPQRVRLHTTPGVRERTHRGSARFTPGPLNPPSLSVTVANVLLYCLDRASADSLTRAWFEASRKGPQVLPATMPGLTASPATPLSTAVVVNLTGTVEAHISGCTPAASPDGTAFLRVATGPLVTVVRDLEALTSIAEVWERAEEAAHTLWLPARFDASADAHSQPPAPSVRPGLTGV